MKKKIEYLNQTFFIEVCLNYEVVTLQGEDVYNVIVYGIGQISNYKKQYEVESIINLKKDLLKIEDITKNFIKETIDKTKTDYLIILKGLGYF